MGTFSYFLGEMDIPEERREEFAQGALKLLRAGGMLIAEPTSMFGHQIYLLHPPELDEEGRAYGCYNYFEDDCWENWSLDAKNGRFACGKIGYRQFHAVALAMGVYTSLYCKSFSAATLESRLLYEGRFIGWINYVLGTQFTNWRDTQMWKFYKLLMEEDHPNKNVYVFNSCSASSGEVLVALKVRELAESGAPFKHVVREVEQFIYQMQTMFVLETLENLRKNGRLTRLQSVITGALKIKLLMGATPEGEICKLGQTLSMKQALSKMVDHMANDPAHAGRVLAICHCNCLDRAFQVKAMAEQRCKFAHILILEAGGITSVYANDGGIVTAY